MISHLEGRDKALEPFGWTGRRAEWIALACLHGGVFTRAQWTDFLGCHWSIHTCRGEGGCLRGARDRPRDPAPAGLPGSGREHPPLLSASSAGRAGRRARRLCVRRSRSRDRDDTPLLGHGTPRTLMLSAALVACGEEGSMHTWHPKRCAGAGFSYPARWLGVAPVAIRPPVPHGQHRCSCKWMVHRPFYRTIEDRTTNPYTTTFSTSISSEWYLLRISIQLSLAAVLRDPPTAHPPFQHEPYCELPLCNRNTWGLSTSLKSRRTPKTSSAPTRMSSKRAGVSTIPSQTPDESHTYHF